jgi:hypothetical protein
VDTFQDLKELPLGLGLVLGQTVLEKGFDGPGLFRLVGSQPYQSGTNITNRRAS